ncbi:Uncharacterised protein [Candidatus Anstonella stagnisolia]|nr:Uncharacterised protein [Candidatus Anstonella stagnisolia]
MNENARFSQLLLCIFLLAGIAAAGFELRSFSVNVNINNDGSSHVEERALIFITTPQSRELYEASRLNNDLSSWRELLGIEEIRQHVSRASVEVARFRFRAEAPERCNSIAGTCFASIVFDYDAIPVQKNDSSRSGIISTYTYKPRTTRYSLNPQAFSFETSNAGDIILSKQTTLSIAIPQDSQKIFFSRDPDNLADKTGNVIFDSKDNLNYYYGSLRTFNWEGQTLSQFELSFEREESLEKEVLQFFKTAQERVSSLLFSSEGPAILIILAVAAASVIYINHMRKRVA